MPIMDEETRKRINDKMVKRAAIEARTSPQFEGVRCRLCGWFSNGKTLDEALGVNYLHERSHRKYKEWVDCGLTIQEVRASLHDHECHPAPCACKCGCDMQIGCVEMGSLCATCQIAQDRGRDEHGALL